MPPLALSVLHDWRHFFFLLAFDLAETVILVVAKLFVLLSKHVVIHKIHDS